MADSEIDPLTAAIMDIARRQREKMDAMERAVVTMPPLAGRVDCKNCYGAGAFYEVQQGPGCLSLGGLQIGDVKSLRVLRRCTCVTIT